MLSSFQYREVYLYNLLNIFNYISLNWWRENIWKKIIWNQPKSNTHKSPFKKWTFLSNGEEKMSWNLTLFHNAFPLLPTHYTDATVKTFDLELWSHLSKKDPYLVWSLPGHTFLLFSCPISHPSSLP